MMRKFLHTPVAFAVLVLCASAAAQNTTTAPTTISIDFGGPKTAVKPPEQTASANATPQPVTVSVSVPVPAASVPTSSAPAPTPVALAMPSAPTPQPVLPMAAPVRQTVMPGGTPSDAPVPVRVMSARPVVMPGGVNETGRFPAPPKPPAATELQTVSPDRITVRHGITARIEVSDKDPSLISTPFRKPKIVDNDKIAQARPMGGDVFVMPSRETTIFIKDGAQANSPVIGLQLVPTRRLSRSVTLIMDGAIPAERRDTTEWANKPNDYIDGLRSTMKQAVMGEVPVGYTEGPLTAPMALSGNLQATPVKRYAGSDSDIYRYRLINKGQSLVTLSEEAFASDKVKAVTIYPNLAIDAGQSTDVYIMFAKEDME